MSNDDNNNVTADIINDLIELKHEIPEAIHHFTQLNQLALQEGQIDKKTKSLIALSLSIMQHSESCMKYHLQTLISQGLNHQALLELAVIAIYMGGGPALMSARYAINTFEALKKSIEN